jgi:hypothetical protein
MDREKLNKALADVDAMLIIARKRIALIYELKYSLLSGQGKCPCREILPEDVGKGTFQVAPHGRNYLASSFIGVIRAQDVGKLVYEKDGILQVENDRQRAERLGR